MPFTDRRGSPIGNMARHIFRTLVKAPSSRDSILVTMFRLEVPIAGVQTKMGDDGRARIEELEGMPGAARLFRNA